MPPPVDAKRHHRILGNNLSRKNEEAAADVPTVSFAAVKRLRAK
jgi:hypothetical protein